MSEETFTERRSSTGISVKLDHLSESVGEMKGVLKELTVAINRLAVVEANQSHAAAALERAFVALAKLEMRIAALETSSADNRRTTSNVDKALWVLAGMTALFIANKVGLIWN